MQQLAAVMRSRQGSLGYSRHQQWRQPYVIRRNKGNFLFPSNNYPKIYKDKRKKDKNFDQCLQAGWQKVFTPDYVTPGDHVFYIAGNNIHNYGNAILNDFAGVYLSSNMHDCGLIQVSLLALASN